MRPSPLHRDPDQDGDDYGGIEPEVNAKIAEVVLNTINGIRLGMLEDAEDVVEYVKARLRAIGRGATDTIVKENVFYDLDRALSDAGIHIEAKLLYGW
jgi:hypothetical protein